MSEYWLVSVPPDKPQQIVTELFNRELNGLCMNHRFNIPELKVGTLDVLVGLSDDLSKMDQYCEGIARKVAQYLGDVLEDERDKLGENLLANGMELSTYLQRFQWDMAKYPMKQPLKNIADLISKQVSQIDADLKAKASAYNAIKGNLQTLERKTTGSLLTRNLGELVKKEDFVLDSEYLVTLLVIVPRASYDDWKKKYETLTDMVAPRSTKLLFEDTENGLFSVTLFKKVAEDYKHRCRENKFPVREFSYNEEELQQGKDEVAKLAADKKKQFGPLVRWLKVNFSEAFVAWVHVKALRVFCESVLRYGLPVNFQAVILQPQKRTAKQIRERLHSMYAHLDNTGSIAKSSNEMDIPGFSLLQADYYPYVYYKLDIDMIDPSKRH